MSITLQTLQTKYFELLRQEMVKPNAELSKQVDELEREIQRLKAGDNKEPIGTPVGGAPKRKTKQAVIANTSSSD
jgi:hypothetical protein